MSDYISPPEKGHPVSKTFLSGGFFIFLYFFRFLSNYICIEAYMSSICDCSYLSIQGS